MENGNESLWFIPGVCSGLTKREYFAAMAMQGLLSICNPQEGIFPNEENIFYMTKLSVKSADALLQELDQNQPSTSPLSV